MIKLFLSTPDGLYRIQIWRIKEQEYKIGTNFLSFPSYKFTLDWYQEVSRGHQAVHGKETEGRWVIDYDVIIPVQLTHPIPEDELLGNLVGELRPHATQVEVTGGKLKVRYLGIENNLLEGCIFDEDAVHLGFEFPRVGTEAHGSGGPWVPRSIRRVLLPPRAI
jgi:hypothetical protein